MDTYTPNNTPIISDTNDKHKRSYKVDSRCNRHWVELMENGRMACMLTVENEQIAEWLGYEWVRTGVVDWNGFMYDSINGLIIA